MKSILLKCASLFCFDACPVYVDHNSLLSLKALSISQGPRSKFLILSFRTPPVQSGPHLQHSASGKRMSLFLAVCLWGLPRVLPSAWKHSFNPFPAAFAWTALAHSASCSLKPLPRKSDPSSVQFSRSVVSDSPPWTAARQASLSITSSQSLPKLMSMESVMPSNHVISLIPDGFKRSALKLHTTPQSLRSRCAEQGIPVGSYPVPPLSYVRYKGGDCVSLTSQPHCLEHPWNIGLCIEGRNHIKCESTDAWSSGRGKKLESSLSHKRKRPEQSNF